VASNRRAGAKKYNGAGSHHRANGRSATNPGHRKLRPKLMMATTAVLVTAIGNSNTTLANAGQGRRRAFRALPTAEGNPESNRPKT
jgi:hypothetical protein